MQHPWHAGKRREFAGKGNSLLPDRDPHIAGLSGRRWETAQLRAALIMIPRYSRPQMTAIWSADSRFRIWFEIEAHAAEAMAELGIIPKEAARKIWEKGKAAKFNVARIEEIEAELSTKPLE